MKRGITMCLLGICCGCELVDISPGGNDNWDMGPVMACAVEYPEGYNWRKDSLGAGAPAKLVLYNDWEKQLEIDVAAKEHVSADPDMHRIDGGHLYSDYSTESETIIKKDGAELFRYSGRESIRDMFVTDTSVFTLGQSRDSQGWSYRLNGRIVLSQKKGQPLSDLYEDEGKLCFAYSLPLGAEEEDGESNEVYRYYVVQDGVPQQVIHALDERKITSIRLCKGELHYLALSSELEGFLWQRGNETLVLGRTRSDDLTGFSLHKAAGELYAHAQYGKAGEDRSSLLWKGDTLKFSSGEYGSIYSFCEDAARLCFVCSKGGRAYPLAIMYGSAFDTIPQRMSMVSPYALCSDGIGYYIGMSDREDNYRPVIMHGKDTVQFGFNGYFTHLSYR